jgi:cytidine deaminase
MMERDDLLDRARQAARTAYAPYSDFHVGAALLFADGSVVTGANVENASYGLSLCAETVAVGKVLSEGGGEALRGGLVAVAVTGGAPGQAGQGATVTPCGRCRQMLNEVAQLGATDPLVWCDGVDVLETTLSSLLPHAFGPANLA